MANGEADYISGRKSCCMFAFAWLEYLSIIHLVTVARWNITGGIMSTAVKRSEKFTISQAIDSSGVSKFTISIFFLVGLAMMFDGYDYIDRKSVV